MDGIRLVATDLDGTFLRDDKTISAANLEALHYLGSRKIVRVAATGRNLHKFHEVIPAEVPFDYVVYSSGAGIYCLTSHRHLYTQNIPAGIGETLLRFFLSEEVNFHVFRPAPDNHLMWYHRGSQPCEEFERYVNYHQSFSNPLPGTGTTGTDLCQFLVVVPGNVHRFTHLKERIEKVSPDIRVIRSSSPLMTGYIWIEVFHRAVSKGNGVLHLCNSLGIRPESTRGIGNDYNDMDLLEITGHSFLTDNAPPELKERFRLVPSNEEDAFAHAIAGFHI